MWPPVAVPLWTVCCLCSGVSYSLVSHPSLGLCHVVPRWVESSWTVDPMLYPAPIWFAGVIIYLHVWDTTQVDSVPDSCQLVASLLLSGWCQSLSICSVAGRCFVGRCVYFVSFTGDIVASSFVSLHIMPTLCVCIHQVTLPCGSVGCRSSEAGRLCCPRKCVSVLLRSRLGCASLLVLLISFF